MMKTKVLVFGSNVSANIVNKGESCKHIELVDHYTRSSFASMASEPLKQKPSEKTLNTSQKRAIRRDFSKEFMTMIAKSSYHVLLIDFLDERFHLLENNGFVVTRSVEFVSSKTRLNGFSLIDAYSEEYFMRWLQGWKSFVTQMRKMKLLNRIRLNKIYWVENEGENDGIASTIIKHNRFVERLYKEAEKDLYAGQVYTYRKNYFVSKGNLVDSFYLDYSEFFYQDGFKYLRGDEKLNELISGIVSHKPRIKLTFKEKVKKYFAQDLPLQLLNANSVNRIKLNDKKRIKLFVKDEIFRPGSKVITFDNGQLLELLYHKPDNTSKNNKKLLVCFNAAVGQRDVKVAPFFSGIGLSDELALPILCIADPLVSQNEELGLAWYAGGENCNSLQLQITELLQEIYNAYGYDLNIFGGSGGGFASLVQATRLEIPATVIVWNPQTSILDYLEDSVSRYLNTAFQNFRTKGDFTYKQTLDWFGIQHRVSAKQVRNNIKLIYLQNQSDNHTDIHAIPFIKSIPVKRIMKAAFYNSDRTRLIYFGDWGRGHLAPPRNLLTFIFKKVLSDECFYEIFKLIEANKTDYRATDKYFYISDFQNADKISFTAERNTQKVKLKANMSGLKVDFSEYLYRFEIRNDSKLLDSLDFQKLNEASFLLADNHTESDLDAVLKVQDNLGNIHTKIMKIAFSELQ